MYERPQPKVVFGNVATTDRHVIKSRIYSISEIRCVCNFAMFLFKKQKSFIINTDDKDFIQSCEI